MFCPLNSKAYWIQPHMLLWRALEHHVSVEREAEGHECTLLIIVA